MFQTLHLSYCSDVDKIHDGIGDKVGLFIQWMASFVGGFVVAFIEDWRLTLLLLVFLPFLAIAGFLIAQVRLANTLYTITLSPTVQDAPGLGVTILTCFPVVCKWFE